MSSTTTTTSPEPAVLLIHAGFHQPETYAPFLTELSAAGFVVRCPRLPTNGDINPPTATLYDDVAAVRTEALDLIRIGHSIIVISHSYGGLVASEAITEDLYAKKYKKNTDHHLEPDSAATDEVDGKEVNNQTNTVGVIHLVYLSAWLLQPHTSLSSLILTHGSQTSLQLTFSPTTFTAIPTNAPSALYHDLPPPYAHFLTQHLVPLNFAATRTAITGAPWKVLPTTYVLCLQDRGILLELQERMVRDADVVLARLEEEEEGGGEVFGHVGEGGEG